MWVSSSAFEKLLDSSHFSIIPFGQRLDPKGEYIKRYVPELKNLPAKYVHQPWLTPADVQEEHDVIVGKDYPSPMIDLSEAMERNCQRMKNIRDSLIPQNHVRPSNEEEIRNFFWIAEKVSIKCN